MTPNLEAARILAMLSDRLSEQADAYRDAAPTAALVMIGLARTFNRTAQDLLDPSQPSALQALAGKMGVE